MSANPNAPDPATAFDDCLRWHVPSRSSPGETYLVDISAYNGNGICQCPDFATRFGPLLSRQVTAEQAVDQGLVHLRPYHQGDKRNALRCAHIMTARADALNAFVAAIVAAKKAQCGPEAF